MTLPAALEPPFFADLCKEVPGLRGKRRRGQIEHRPRPQHFSCHIVVAGVQRDGEDRVGITHDLRDRPRKWNAAASVVARVEDRVGEGVGVVCGAGQLVEVPRKA